MSSNSLASNFARKLKHQFLPNFETKRVITKAVNTQLFKGMFNPSSGKNIDIKRPHQYLAVETAAGDLTSATANKIIAGKATATVQNYITVDVPWDEIEEALELNQLDQILSATSEELVSTLETNFYDFMVANAALSVGVPGTAVDAWSDLAAANTLMRSLGVPRGQHYYIMNDGTVEALASAQSALTPDGNGTLVKTAWEDAQIATPFAGLRAITSNGMGTRTIGTSTDRIGALAATPTATYAAAKDSMTQSLSVTGLTASQTGALKAGDILEFTGTGADARSYLNWRTRVPVFSAAGAAVKWRCTVTADVDTDSSGDIAAVIVTGPAIVESSGQYNNISAALASGDVFSVLGAVGTTHQPNLFFHKDAFTCAFVKLKRLHGWDTNIITKDGINIRVTKYSDSTKNTQGARFDILPAFGCMSPFMAGQGFGK